jgi:hypothetical protein
MLEILLAVIGAAVVAAISYGVTRFAIWYRQRQAFGHLSKFVSPNGDVTIVLSSLPEQTLEVLADDFLKAQPRNVLFGPLAEGATLARLWLALQIARRDVTVDLLPAEDFTWESTNRPFICIGGPSVNRATKGVVEKYAPYFELRYPEHTAYVDGKPLKADISSGGRYLTDDYGFILSGRTDQDIPFIVLCGIYAYGTLIAARALIDLSDKKRYSRGEKARIIRSEDLFLVVHSTVARYQTGQRIDPVYHFARGVEN